MKWAAKGGLKPYAWPEVGRDVTRKRTRIRWGTAPVVWYKACKLPFYLWQHCALLDQENEIYPVAHNHRVARG